jgi:hypothetical protein
MSMKQIRRERQRELQEQRRQQRVANNEEPLFARRVLFPEIVFAEVQATTPER